MLVGLPESCAVRKISKSSGARSVALRFIIGGEPLSATQTTRLAQGKASSFENCTRIQSTFRETHPVRSCALSAFGDCRRAGGPAVIDHRMVPTCD